MGMIRAFLAIDVSYVLRRKVAELQNALREALMAGEARPARISWAQPGSLHLTIKFLGDTDEQLLDPLHEAIARAIDHHRAIPIPLERVGAFPRAREPRVLWVGPSESWERSEDARRLEDVHRAIDAACASLGFPRDDRPFDPHLTLARIKSGGRQVGLALSRLGTMERPNSLGPLDLRTIGFVKSDLSSGSAVHTTLWRVQTGT
jgi:2'-5' RNA ligase